MNIWDGEYAFSIQAAFRSESMALSHPVIRFQLALFWSTKLSFSVLIPRGVAVVRLDVDRPLEQKRFVEAVQLVLDRFRGPLGIRKLLANGRLPRLPDLLPAARQAASTGLAANEAAQWEVGCARMRGAALGTRPDRIAWTR
jgi:hypothetical protein